MFSEIRNLPPAHPQYPPLLRALGGKKLPVLRIQGTFPAFSSHTYIATVGTRTPSWQGKQLAQELVSRLSPFPVCIVSGLATGIDQECHRQALHQGLPTIAILGHGLRIRLHGEKKRLAQQILANGGAIISPFPDDLSARKGTFVARNRIIAGLSHYTILVESRENGGAMHTAANCMELGRTLLTFPGDILRATSSGANTLIASESAIPIWSMDFLPDLCGLFNPRANSIPSPVGTHKQTELFEPGYTLCQQFQGQQLEISQLLETTGLELSALLSILGQLEIQGLVQSSGSYFCFPGLHKD